MDDFGKELEGANLFFSTAVTAFNNPVARKMANTTHKMCSLTKSLDNMEPSVDYNQIECGKILFQKHFKIQVQKPSTT